MKGSLLGISLMVFLIASLMLVGSEVATSSASSSPKIYVNPRVSSVAPGDSFTVDIVIAGIAENESLIAWESDISFNSTILNVTSVMQGSFLKTVGTSYWPAPVINNLEGTVEVSESFMPPWPESGAIGSGVLANITLQVLDEGETSLHFFGDTGLNTYNGTDILPIEHTAVDGFFAYPLMRDVAVTDVMVSSTSVRAGETMSINVTAENSGEIAETFDVTVLYNSTEIETKTLTDLASDGSEVLQFSWDTEDVAEGNYRITAVASELSGETDTADNTYTNVFVAVTAPSSAFPIEYIIAIVAVVIVVVIICGVTLFRKRRKQTKS